MSLSGGNLSVRPLNSARAFKCIPFAGEGARAQRAPRPKPGERGRRRDENKSRANWRLRLRVESADRALLRRRLRLRPERALRSLRYQRQNHQQVGKAIRNDTCHEPSQRSAMLLTIPTLFSVAMKETTPDISRDRVSGISSAPYRAGSRLNVMSVVPLAATSPFGNISEHIAGRHSTANPSGHLSEHFWVAQMAG